MEHLKTVRDKDCKDYQDLITRLNRIEGQVRGVKKMLEEDRYCVDILTQVSAITNGLNAFNKKLLANYIKSCVVNDIRAGDDSVVDELCETLQKLMKLNPLYHYINLFRNLMMYGNIPGPNTWIACIFCAVASMAIGLLVFRKLQKNFILYI